MAPPHCVAESTEAAIADSGVWQGVLLVSVVSVGDDDQG